MLARKNSEIGIAAWQAAFADDLTARLIIKARFQYRAYVPDDPRIQFVDSDEPTRGIAHWYRQADVLLALGNEGFGLPLIEGMATGLPVIALDSEGQGDVCADAPGCLLPVPPARWVPYDEPPYGPAGVRGVPAVAAVAAQLRWVADHRTEAAALGQRAAAWVAAARPVWSKGPAVLDVIERYTPQSRPLRRQPAMWVPSWGSPCGVAEYTAHIAACLPGVAITATPPDPAGVRVLHIQHEHGLFDAAALTAQVQETRAAGVPVVITEHTVSPEAAAWEREADVLVALTAQGTAQLQARWPGKRVVHLPPGCPTWFPPRKARRARVIGVFGFLEPYKGFWSLLKVLRTLPGTELRMFSYAKSAPTAARWEAAAAGLPVRREAAFLPVAEIATRLAAEADILVFWYDDLPLAAASYAVRIGLATGVPVLTSPTAWFHDVRAATYQPADLAAGVARLLDDTALRAQLSAAAHAYCHQWSWDQIAERHRALWQTLTAL